MDRLRAVACGEGILPRSGVVASPRNHRIGTRRGIAVPPGNGGTGARRGVGLPAPNGRKIGTRVIRLPAADGHSPTRGRVADTSCDGGLRSVGAYRIAVAPAD